MASRQVVMADELAISSVMRPVAWWRPGAVQRGRGRLLFFGEAFSRPRFVSLLRDVARLQVLQWRGRGAGPSLVATAPRFIVGESAGALMGELGAGRSVGIAEP